MKRLHSYWLQPFEFSEGTRTAIRERLKDKANAYLAAIREECAHYAESITAEVPRRQVKGWRAQIEATGRSAGAIVKAIQALDEDGLRYLDQYFVLDSGRLDARASAIASLEQIERVCARATASRGLNPPEGNPTDFDRRRLAMACAEAYRHATGKAPKTSPNGTFAGVLLPVLHAVRAIPQSQASVSKEFLQSVLAKGN